MKKITKYLSVLLVAALVVTGCGKKSSSVNGSESKDNVSLEEALKNTFNEKSYKFNSTTEFELSASGSDVQGISSGKASIAFSGEMDKNNNVYAKINMKTTTSDNTNEENGEIYLDMTDKKQYIGHDGKWSFEKIDQDNIDLVNKIDPTTITDYIKESKKVDSDKEEYTKYEVSFDVLKALKSVGEEDVTLLANSLQLPDIKINMYVKGKYVAFISYDLGEQLNSVINNIISLMYTTTDSNGKTATAPKVNIVLKGTMELTDFGSVEVKVPDEVKNNAKEGNVVYTQNAIAEKAEVSR